MASGESWSITESAGVSTKRLESERGRDADMERERDEDHREQDGKSFTRQRAPTWFLSMVPLLCNFREETLQNLF